MICAFDLLKYFMIISKSSCKNDLVLVGGDCDRYLIKFDYYNELRARIFIAGFDVVAVLSCTGDPAAVNPPVQR